MYIRVLCTIIYQSDDLALSASDKNPPAVTATLLKLLMLNSRVSEVGGMMNPKAVSIN